MLDVYVSMLHVHFPCCFSMLHAKDASTIVNDACPGCISMLHSYASCPCCVPRACSHCMSMLHDILREHEHEQENGNRTEKLNIRYRILEL
jgi:hypothetical protein